MQLPVGDGRWILLTEGTVRDAVVAISGILPGIDELTIREGTAVAMGFKTDRGLRGGCSDKKSDAAGSVAKAFLNFEALKAAFGPLASELSIADLAETIGSGSSRDAKLQKPNWPFSVPFGVHIVASGLCWSPKSPLHLAVEAEAASVSGGSYPFRVLSYGEKRVECYDLVPVGKAWAVEPVFDHPLGTPATMTALDAVHRSGSVFHIIPEATTPYLARMALTFGTVGWRTIVGITAADSASALQALAKLVYLDKTAAKTDQRLTNPNIIRRIDVVAAFAPEMLLLESVSCTEEKLVEMLNKSLRR